MEQLEVVVSGKLQEMDKEPVNVQVVVFDSEGHVSKLQLMYEGEVFIEADPYPPEVQGTEASEAGSDREDTERTGEDEKQAEIAKLKEELERVVSSKDEQIASLESELEAAREKLLTLGTALANEKGKLKDVWRMNCEQLAAYDEELTSKDAQIEELHARLCELPPTRPLDPTADTFVPTLSLTTTSPPVASVHVKRQGKAPPVDSFSGESTELRFEDWLPSLERASTWNGWSEQEKLIQLAGHFRGKALQEWNLLSEEDKSTFSQAMARMKDVLGPGSRVMAAQDFRHTLQEENESVGNYIRRLERAFRIAHGSDKLDAESRSIFLFTQMQEGLRQEVMRSPSVSGALSYAELCMAAKNEEKRTSCRVEEEAAVQATTQTCQSKLTDQRRAKEEFYPKVD